MRFVPMRAAILGLVLAAVVTLPGLGNGTLWDNSETVYSEVGREILLTHDWLVMHLNGAAWFVQPPLYFWICAICAHVFGVNAFAFRLPAALATIAMGAVLGYATARAAGTRAGIIAAVVLSTCLMQAIVGRLAIMDALLDLCVVIAIVCWFRAFQPRDGSTSAQPRAAPFVAGALALAFGTLAKGPVAPVIVVLVIGVWLIWEARSGATIVLPRVPTLLAATALFAAIVLPWFVLEAIRVGPDAARELIGHYTVGRYTGVIENQRGPWWYYVPVLILGAFPWIAFVPVATSRVVDAARTREGSLERLALTWAIVPLVFFSFAQTKLPNYIALMLPAVAIIVALWFERLADAIDRRAAIWSAATIPLFVGALGVAIVIFIRNNHLESTLAIVGPQAETLGVLMLLGSLATVVAIATAGWGAFAPYVLAATSGVLILFIAFVAEPAAEQFKPIPPLAAAIQARRAPGATVAIRGVAGSYALLFYTAPVLLDVDDERDAAFVAAVCTQRDLYLVTHVADMPRLMTIVTARGRHSAQLSERRGVAIVHVDGPPCTGGSGGSMSHDS